MENRLNYFKYASDYLNQARINQQNFVIDGDSSKIGDVDITELLDLDFDKDLSDELVVVHATDYSPARNNAIVSTESTYRKDFFYLYDTYVDSHRITVHTTLNTLVKKNNGGDWAHKLFIIIEPFSNIKSKVCGFGVSDTFFKDKIELSKDGVVLVREEDKEKLTEEDKKMNIVYYKGYPRMAVYKAMIMMGYKPQQLKISTIVNEKNNSMLDDFRFSQNYGPSLHSYTVYSLVEDQLSFRDIFISELRNQSVDTCLNPNTNIDEVEALIQSKKVDYRDEKVETIRCLLEYGIDFNEHGPYFLNTHQTIDRISKYYDHEHFQFNIKDSKDLERYSELVDILNKYQSFIQINRDYTSALKTNNMLNSLPPSIVLEEFYTNDYIKEYVQKWNKIFSNTKFSLSVQPNQFIITSLNDNDFKIFNDKLFNGMNLSELEDIDYVMIKFDPNKSLIENLRISASQVYEILNILEKNNYIIITPEMRNELDKLTSQYNNTFNATINDNQSDILLGDKFDDKDFVADQMIQAMESGILDINGTPIQNQYNESTRTMGFGTFCMIIICSFLTICAILILGVLFIK